MIVYFFNDRVEKKQRPPCCGQVERTSNGRPHVGECGDHEERGAVGWVGLDAPLELIEAAGLRPQRIVADARSEAHAVDPYGEGGGHPWMRAMAAELIEAAPTLERVVLCSTPVNELWLYNFILSLALRRESGLFPPAELLNLSHEARPSALRLNRSSLRMLAKSLAVTGEDAIRQAIARRNRVRAALRAIDGQALWRGGRISGSRLGG